MTDQYSYLKNKSATHARMILPDWSRPLFDATTPRKADQKILLTDSSGRNAEDLLAAALLVGNADRQSARPTFIFGDDRRHQATGQAVAQSAVEAGVTAVVGHFSSSVAVAAAQVYARHDIPFFSPSASSDMLKGTDEAPIFTIYPRDSVLIAYLVRYLSETSDPVHLFGETDNNGSFLTRCIAQELTKMGKLVDHAVSRTATLPTRLLATNPNRTILVLGSAEFMRKVLSSLTFSAAKEVILADDVLDDPTVSELATQKHLSVLVFGAAQAATPPNWLNTCNLCDDAEHILGRKPGPYFTTACFIFRILQATLTDNPLSSQALCEKLAQVTWDSPFGLMRFKTDGSTTGSDGWRLFPASTTGPT